MYKQLIVWSATTGLLLFGINALASVLYWYSSIWWFDMAMHAFGGLFVALVGGAWMSKRLTYLTAGEVFITLSLFVFIVGLAWEYYEYIVQMYIKSVRLAELGDSISDLICDMIGGSIGAGFVILLRKRYNRG